MAKDVTAGSRTRVAGGDASALGYLALGLTLLAFGLFNADVVSDATVRDGTTLALFVGGITQFVAGLWEFRGGSVLTGTAFTGLGAFWFTWASAVDTKASEAATGYFLLLWALLALSLTVASWTSGPVAQVVFGLLFVALLILSIAQFAGTDGLIVRIAGWVAVVAGAAGWYGATASLANGAHGKSVLPLGR